MKIVEEKPVMVFKKENKYTVGISNKKQDGSYENAYFPIQFNKGIELNDKTRIYIKNAWLSFYKWEYQEKKGTTFFIRCSEFETVEETINQSKQQTSINIKDVDANDPFKNFGDEIEVSDNLLE